MVLGERLRSAADHLRGVVEAVEALAATCAGVGGEVPAHGAAVGGCPGIDGGLASQVVLEEDGGRLLHLLRLLLCERLQRHLGR